MRLVRHIRKATPRERQKLGICVGMEVKIAGRSYSVTTITIDAVSGSEQVILEDTAHWKSRHRADWLNG